MTSRIKRQEHDSSHHQEIVRNFTIFLANAQGFHHFSGDGNSEEDFRISRIPDAVIVEMTRSRLFIPYKVEDVTEGYKIVGGFIGLDVQPSANDPR